jgi:hypothetical protein
MKSRSKSLVACLLLGLAAPAFAASNTVTLYPNNVPDEMNPRGVQGDFPAGYGSGSWMNSATGKVNAYVTPNDLFGHGITVGDIGSINYFTKAPAGTSNWFVIIYTAPDAAGGNDSSWYGQRFVNSDYVGYTSDGAWHDNSVSSILRTSGSAFSGSLADWTTAYAAKNVLFFSVHTDSAVNGSDAQIDGLRVALNGTSGEVGTVNFEAVPVPTPAAAAGGLALLGLSALKRRRAAQI